MLPFNVWAQSLWETLYMVIVSTVISYAVFCLKKRKVPWAH